jgi:hypothetical protein
MTSENGMSILLALEGVECITWLLAVITSNPCCGTFAGDCHQVGFILDDHD